MMLSATIVSLERLGREIEDAEFQLQLWRGQLDKALEGRQTSFRSGTSMWSERHHLLVRIQRIVSSWSDLVGALKAARPIMQSRKGSAP